MMSSPRHMGPGRPSRCALAMPCGCCWGAAMGSGSGRGMAGRAAGRCPARRHQQSSSTHPPAGACAASGRCQQERSRAGRERSRGGVRGASKAPASASKVVGVSARGWGMGCDGGASGGRRRGLSDCWTRPPRASVWRATCRQQQEGGAGPTGGGTRGQLCEQRRGCVSSGEAAQTCTHGTRVRRGAQSLRSTPVVAVATPLSNGTCGTAARASSSSAAGPDKPAMARLGEKK